MAVPVQFRVDHLHRARPTLRPQAGEAPPIAREGAALRSITGLATRPARARLATRRRTATPRHLRTAVRAVSTSELSTKQIQKRHSRAPRAGDRSAWD